MTKKNKIENMEDKSCTKTISPKIKKIKMDQEQNLIVLLRRVTLLGAVGAVVVAVLGLLGYIPGLKCLGNISEAYIPMAPSTAVSFIVLGGGLLALNFKAFLSTKRMIFLGGLLTLLVALFGALEVVGHFTGWDLNFEDTIVPSAGYLGEIPIARMSPATGALFFLAGLAIFVFLLQEKQTSDRKNRLKDCGGIMASVLVVTASVFCLAYLYGSPLFYAQKNTIPMALTTALAFLLLGVASICAFGGEAVPVRWLVRAINTTKAMGPRKRFAFLAIIMILTCILVMGVITLVLYRHDKQEHRETLQVIAQTQARLIESIARYDARMSAILQEQNPNHDFIDATISKVIDAHERSKGFGMTGEFTLARRKGNTISFILRQRHSNTEYPKPVALNSNLAEPMRRALKGESGTVIGLDYRGVEVLAAYEPVGILNFGIVAKTNLSEIRAPFIRSSIIGTIVAFFLIFFNLLIFFQIGRPMISSLEKYSKNLENEIEERKSSEEKLKESEEKYRNLYEQSPFGLLLCRLLRDGKGKAIDYIHLEANKSVAIHLGWNLKDVIGTRVSEMLTPDEHMELTQRFETMIASGKSTSYIRHFDAFNKTFKVTAFPVHEDDFIINFIDITDREKVEKALRESKERLSLTVTAAGIGLWDWNIKTGEVIYSDRWTGMLGYSTEEITPDIAGWEKLIHQEDKSQALECIDKYLKGVISTYRNEFRLRNKSGQWTWILACGKILERNKKGEPLRMAGIHLDITVSKEFEKEREVLLQEMEKKVADRTSELANRIKESEKLNRGMVNLLEDVNSINKKFKNALQDLEASNQELKSFSYSVSHDLRAPLRALDGFSQVLMDDYKDKLDKDGQDSLQRIRKASVKMGKLIDSLLKLSRISQVQMKAEKTDLSKIAGNITRKFIQDSPERDATFVIQPDMIVDGDASLLEIVLDNLLGNAWKFTRKKKKTQIEFSSKKDAKSQETVYSIRDNGAGFNMAYADKLFGAFQRLHTQNEFEGSGIGLATVNRIIQRHHGKIWVESVEDEGTVFYFTLNM